MVHSTLGALKEPLPELVAESTSRVRKGLKALAFYAKVRRR
jgi:hypothetical protein